MTEQSELFAHAEPECPGFDVCPVPMCGCRWVNQGSPWREEKDAIISQSTVDTCNDIA